MLALHGGWLLDAPPHPSRFVVWAEQQAVRPRGGPSRGRRGPPASSGAGLPHPFAAHPAQLSDTLGARCGRSAGSPGRPEAVAARLPTCDGRPLPSPSLAVGPPPAAEPALTCWRLPVLAYDPLPAAQLLLALAALEPSPDVRL